MDIFVVEDEYWALEELKVLLKKYENKYHVYYFKDGYEAFRYLNKITPDLVITDITMPRMDGLQLVEKVKDYDPFIECMLLTVHDTFDYAQKGIQLGVADYILKPVKKDELYKKIDWIVKKINKRKQNEKERQSWLMYKLLLDSLSQKNYDIKQFDKQSYILILILFGNWNTFILGSESIIIDENEIKGLIGNDRECWSLSVTGNQKVLLITEDKEQPLISYPLKNIHNYLLQFGQAHMCVIKKGEQTSLREAFQEANLILEKGKLFGRPTLLTDTTKVKEIDIYELWDNVRILEQKMINGEAAEIRKYIQNILKCLKKTKITQRQLFQFLLDMYYAFQFKLQESRNFMNQLDEFYENFNKLQSLYTYKDLEKWLSNLVYKIMEIMITDEKIAPKHLIPGVKQWIEESYQNDITFQQFADKHYVSLSYLSREFKKQMGVTFSEYLTMVRIEQAKRFIKNGINKTSEIAELVGYKDEKHFRNVFRRITGMTPTNYRKSLTKE